MDTEYIYIVSVSENENFEKRDRVGWFNDENTALDAVKQNKTDIWETCYTYAMIEKVRHGLYPTCEKVWAFKYRVIDESNPTGGVYDLIKETTDFKELQKYPTTFVG